MSRLAKLQRFVLMRLCVELLVVAGMAINILYLMRLRTSIESVDFSRLSTPVIGQSQSSRPILSGSGQQQPAAAIEVQKHYVVEGWADDLPIIGGQVVRLGQSIDYGRLLRSEPPISLCIGFDGQPCLLVDRRLMMSEQPASD